MQGELVQRGHEVEIPEGIKRAELRRLNASIEEKAEVKIRHDLIRGYYEKMKAYDVVLIVNPELKGIAGYIGGNTLIEMSFALVLNKRLYCLYPLPEMPYSSELVAMQPIILAGNLDAIR